MKKTDLQLIAEFLDKQHQQCNACNWKSRYKKKNGKAVLKAGDNEKAPVQISSVPVRLIPAARVLTIDLSAYPDLEKTLLRKAHEEMRTPEMQMLYMLKEQLENEASR